MVGRTRNFANLGGLSFSFILRFASLSVATASRSKFRRSSVTYYMYAPSLGSFPPRLLVAKFSFTAFATASRALRALARSKKKKILRFIVLRSNSKSNLQISVSNFTHRDPHVENANLTCTQCSNLSRAVGLKRASASLR